MITYEEAKNRIHEGLLVITLEEYLEMRREMLAQEYLKKFYGGKLPFVQLASTESITAEFVIRMPLEGNRVCYREPPKITKE